MPLLLLASVQKNLEPDLSSVPTHFADLAWFCVCLWFPWCGTKHTSEQTPPSSSQNHQFLICSCCMCYKVPIWKLDIWFPSKHIFSHYIIALVWVVPKVTLEIRTCMLEVIRRWFQKTGMKCRTCGTDKREIQCENVIVRLLLWEMVHYSTGTSWEVHRMPFTVAHLRMNWQHWPIGLYTLLVKHYSVEIYSSKFQSGFDWGRSLRQLQCTL